MTIEPYSGENRTLVVDDHDISCRYVMAALGQCAGTIKLARNAREAIATALAWYPDLICMDIHLPDINGLELVAFAKNNNAYRSIPLVIVSTEGAERDRERGLELGADAYLVKPFEPENLREVVVDLLSRCGLSE